MARSSSAKAVTWSISEQALPAHHGDAVALPWSHGRIRFAALLLLGAALPAIVGFAIAGPFLKWLSLAWLAGVAALMDRLSRRASTDAVVLSIDRQGILDRRLMPRPIEWREIEAICPVDPSRSHVVEIRLRWPESTLAGTRWPVRIGAYCQRACGIPAVTINMMLLDGSIRDVLEAIARHRPDLLDPMNRNEYGAHR